jgi:HEAT repeat protein
LSVSAHAFTLASVAEQERSDKVAFGVVRDFYASYASGTARQRAKAIARAPLAEIQTSALRHPDPFVRRWCLFFLDHYANDASMPVFARALQDPIDFVRNMALHSLACEACKEQELCTADVVPGLLEVLNNDPNPELRLKAIPLLLRLSSSDGRARAAVQASAVSDQDPIVRRAAADALAGRLVQPRKRYQRQQRRHATSVR